ncbi:MAG: hypothetical protein K2N72_02345 [Oscillospiraceae bacterium]|nr:hypothetical protein [Oscillospiraceae bacterium]
MMIDFEELRNDLEDYYGTAAASFFPAAYSEAYDAAYASPEELIEMAEEVGLDRQFS